MKTRNNQSNADETLLNQSITRRSFVKRSAVASAATVFGLSMAAKAQSLNTTPWLKTFSLPSAVPLSWDTQPTVAQINLAITEAIEAGTQTGTSYCYTMNERTPPANTCPGTTTPTLNPDTGKWELTLPSGTGYQIQYGNPTSWR